MLKTDYKIGQKVESIKPGILNGLQGEVLANHTEKENMQLVVICGSLGTWNFNYTDVIPLGQVNTSSTKESSTESLKTSNKSKLKMATSNGSAIIKEIGTENKVENLEVVQSKQKRSYNKRPKDELKKEKRKYTRKK